MRPSDFAGLRIVQVHSHDRGGGAEAVVAQHHAEMRRRAIAAKLYVARKSAQREGTEEIKYVRGLPGSRRLARSFEMATGGQYLYSPSFRALLNDLRLTADVVHFHSMHGAEGYAELLPLRNFFAEKPSIVTLHDMWLMTGHCAQPLGCSKWQTGCGQCPDLSISPGIPRDGTAFNWRYKRWIFGAPNVYLSVPSSWVQRQVALSPILSHLPSVVIPNPVDTIIFSPGNKAKARAELGLPAERPIALLVAQSLLLVFKGGELGVAAVAKAQVPDIFLVAIGPDAEAALQKAGVEGVAVPYQSDPNRLAQYYRAADVLVMPSRAETFGMVAAEAMACGTPVVAFAAGGLTDVLGDDEGGLLVPELDVASMSMAIRELIRDEAKRGSLARSAAERAHRHFSLTRHTDLTLALYSRAIESRNADTRAG